MARDPFAVAVIPMADPNNPKPAPAPVAARPPSEGSSASEQILGRATDSKPTQIDPKWQFFYEELIARRDALIDAQTDLAGKTREINPDSRKNEPAEVGTEAFQRDQLLGMRSFEQETLFEIDAALSRLKTGTYGICEASGEKIPEERLKALPWARYTLEVQREMEERGQTTTAAIGALGDMRERKTAPPGPWRDHEGST